MQPRTTARPRANRSLTRALLPVFAAWTVSGAIALACGPSIDPEALRPEAEELEDLDCTECTAIACQPELARCAADASCDCTAACLQDLELEDVPGADATFACADYCFELSSVLWGPLSQCGADRCDACPAELAQRPE